MKTKHRTGTKIFTRILIQKLKNEEQKSLMKTKADENFVERRASENDETETCC